MRLFDEIRTHFRETPTNEAPPEADRRPAAGICASVSWRAAQFFQFALSFLQILLLADHASISHKNI